MKKIIIATALTLLMVGCGDSAFKEDNTTKVDSNSSVTSVNSEETAMPNAASDGNNTIEQKQPVNDLTSQSNNIAPSTPQCMYFEVIGVPQLNLRDKPGKSSNIVGRANSRDESFCIYESQGKWARSDRGWLSMKYLRKDVRKNKFLLADIDNDGQKERLQLDSIPSDDPEMEVYQLKLFDDNGDILWEGPLNTEDKLVVGYQYVSGRFPVIFDDIDGDGNTELIISIPPHEPYSIGFYIYRWTGKNFKRITKSKYPIDLVWTDAPSGKTLKWTKIDDKEYEKKKKIWWVGDLWQMPNNELPMVEIVGVQYPDYKVFSMPKAKIRFTPTGAVIEEWIK